MFEHFIRSRVSVPTKLLLPTRVPGHVPLPSKPGGLDPVWGSLQSGVQDYPVVESLKGSRFLRPISCFANLCSICGFGRSLKGCRGAMGTVRFEDWNVNPRSWQSLLKPSSQRWWCHRLMRLDEWNKEAKVISVNPKLRSPSQIILKGPNWTEQRVFWECSHINPPPHVVFSRVLKN